MGCQVSPHTQLSVAATEKDALHCWKYPLKILTKSRIRCSFSASPLNARLSPKRAMKSARTKRRQNIRLSCLCAPGSAQIAALIGSRRCENLFRSGAVIRPALGALGAARAVRAFRAVRAVRDGGWVRPGVSRDGSTDRSPRHRSPHPRR